MKVMALVGVEWTGSCCGSKSRSLEISQSGLCFTLPLATSGSSILAADLVLHVSPLALQSIGQSIYNLEVDVTGKVGEHELWYLWPISHIVYQDHDRLLHELLPYRCADRQSIMQHRDGALSGRT